MVINWELFLMMIRMKVWDLVRVRHVYRCIVEAVRMRKMIILLEKIELVLIVLNNHLKHLMLLPLDPFHLLYLVLKSDCLFIVSVNISRASFL